MQQNLRFQGQYLDRESGLHYNTFRFYDPDIGRFISPDPIGLAGGSNFYQYAPNPISWIDPFGLCAAKTATAAETVAARVITETGELRLSASVADKYAATRPYVSPLTVQETIAGGVRVPDPQGVAGRFMYTVDALYAAGPGKVVAGINGSEAAVIVKSSIGKFEVLVNELTYTIEHALFKSGKP